VRKLLSVVLGLSLSTPLMANEVSFERYVEGLKQQARNEGISEQI
jgi:membrane-bound lytic murein transglycosylase B